LSFKKYFFRAASASGLGEAIRDSQWRSQRLAILCYHSISLRDEHEGLPSLYMTASFFKTRMQYLRRLGFNVLPLSKALTALYAGTLPPRSVALTFDDGTRDFFERAVPILSELNIPATVYITTSYSEQRWPVFDTAIRYMVWRARGSDIDLGAVCGFPSLQGAHLNTDEACFANGLRARHEAVRLGFSAVQKHELLHKLSSAVGVDFDAFVGGGQFQIMPPEQIFKLPTRLINIGLHTHRHRMPRDEHLFLREILDNQESISRATNGRKATHFCYPSGEYGQIFLPWLDRVGIRSATTCVPGLATRHSNPLLLPRFIDTMAASEDIFASWLDGTSEWLPRRNIHRLDESV
jgi:peptidoglycan/xylan/chitin deacetylase (PgdA/CDA1 family)